jgi:glutamate N-acetyltransferase/amino-acid N-acetyltransferase
MIPVHAEAGKNSKSVVGKNSLFRVTGFSAASTSAGIKKGSAKQDLGLIFSEVPAVASGVFTRNLVKAAPVLLDMERMAAGIGRAILVNSGNANACTGALGLKDAQKISRRLSQKLAIPDDQVFLASTGVIGQRLPLSRISTAIPGLIESLTPDGLSAVAEAIMTTDTFPKILSKELVLGKKKVRIVVMAKGAGMIQPNMATMLCFVLTDAAISPALLDRMLKKAVERSFNRITVDGDTSTNDMVLVLANGLAGNTLLDKESSPGARSFGRALEALLIILAKMIIRDGEGATKALTLLLEGARNKEEARTLAFTVANSPLVKTALFGQDANWGRIMAALGRAGVDFDPNRVDIFFDTVQVVKNGIGLGAEAENRAGEVLRKPTLTLRIHLHQGKSRTSVYTCDLSLDYVRINADYRT